MVIQQLDDGFRRDVHRRARQVWRKDLEFIPQRRLLIFPEPAVERERVQQNECQALNYGL